MGNIIQYREKQIKLAKEYFEEYKKTGYKGVVQKFKYQYNSVTLCQFLKRWVKDQYKEFRKEKTKDIIIPSKEKLQEQLKTMNYSQIGRYYNRTISFVRRWCKKYGIMLTKEQIKERQKQNLQKNVEKHKQQVTFS